MSEDQTLLVKNELEGVVLGATSQFVWIDIGGDNLAVASAAEFASLRRNEKISVNLIGSDPECLCLVSRAHWKPPRSLEDLKRAFEEKRVITGIVTAFVKGGFRVDVGRQAFMPISRSGGRDRQEREELIGKEILCTVEEFDEVDENVVIDRRRLLEEAELWGQRCVLEELKVGTKVRGPVCTLTDFGAFVDLGGIDGFVHVRDIAWHYLDKPADVLSLGQEVEALIEKIHPKQGRVVLNIKALCADPWENVENSYRAGDRVKGTITHVTTFGAFVELEPGIEGLVHQEDLTWSRILPSEVVAPGTADDFLILEVNKDKRRIALSRKHLIADPWQGVDQRFPVGSVVTGRVTSVTSFGAFVAVDREIEGLIHVSDISSRRINHPSDVLVVQQQVRAQVLESDGASHRLRLGIRQLKNISEYGASADPQSNTKNIPATTSADFSHYSDSVLVNCSIDGPDRAITDAIVFTLLDSGLLPRFSYERNGLFFAVRECQHAIHDVSQVLQMGIFWGCKEYGSDIHRMKTMLLITSGMPHEMFGQAVRSHSNDAVHAVQLVAEWVARISATATVDANKVWSRYTRFLADSSFKLQKRDEETSAESISTFIVLARQWLQTNGLMSVVRARGV